MGVIISTDHVLNNDYIITKEKFRKKYSGNDRVRTLVLSKLKNLINIFTF